MKSEQDPEDKENLADFYIGFQARVDDRPFDPAASEAWRRGWESADRDIEKHRAV